MNYNIRREIEAGSSRLDIMRKYNVPGEFVDAMDIRHILDDEEDERWY